MKCKQCSARNVPALRVGWATPVCFACVAPKAVEAQLVSEALEALQVRFGDLLESWTANNNELAALRVAAPSPETGTAAVPCYCDGGTEIRHPDGSLCPGSIGQAAGPAPEPVKPPRLGICPACHRSDCICADPTVPAAEPGKPMEWTVCPTCGGPDLRVVAAVQGLTCGALANDGTACTRLPHPESPDYHTDGTEYCWIGGTGRTPAAGDSAITMSGCELVDCDRPEPHTHQGRCEHPSPGDGSCDNCRCADAPGGTRP